MLLFVHCSLLPSCYTFKTLLVVVLRVWGVRASKNERTKCEKWESTFLAPAAAKKACVETSRVGNTVATKTSDAKKNFYGWYFWFSNSPFTASHPFFTDCKKRERESMEARRLLTLWTGAKWWISYIWKLFHGMCRRYAPALVCRRLSFQLNWYLLQSSRSCRKKVLWGSGVLKCRRRICKSKMIEISEKILFANPDREEKKLCRGNGEIWISIRIDFFVGFFCYCCEKKSSSMSRQCWWLATRGKESVKCRGLRLS